MPNLFGRTYELEIGKRRFTKQRTYFEVEKSIKPDPNTAEIKIYNLNETERNELSKGFEEQLKNKTANVGTLVRLSAGYLETRPIQIFYGNLIHVMHTFDAQDIITTLSSGDGVEAYQKARIHASFGPGTQASSVFQALVKALNLKPGNAQRALEKLVKDKSASMYLQGTVLSGSVARELSNLCRSAGLEWSIQDSTLFFTDIKPLQAATATVLTSRNGLVGSPSISNKGIVSGRCFILPGLIPGLQIQLKARFVQGLFQLAKVKYTGDTHDTAWYCDFEAVQVGTSPEIVEEKRKRKT